MNPMPVIFVLIVVGLQDYGITPVSGYDAATAQKIIYCANLAHNGISGDYGINNFEDIVGAIDNETLDKRIRVLLTTDSMVDTFKKMMEKKVENVNANDVLGK